MAQRGSLILTLVLTMLALTFTSHAQQTDRPALTGCFYEWLGTPQWPAQRWDQELEWMANAGVKHMVMHCAALKGEAYYPTRLDWLEDKYKNDAMEHVFSAADKYGISIYLYGYDDPAYWNSKTVEFFDDFVAKGKLVMSDVWDQFKHHKSLSGFHLSPEFWYPCEDDYVDLWVEHYIKPFAAHVKSLDPKLKVTTAPFVGTMFPYSEKYQRYESEQYKAYWDKVLSANSIDIMIPQDGIGADEFLPGGSKGRTYALVRQIYRDTREVADKHGVQLWDDLECFEAVGVCYPNHFARTQRQLQAAHPFATNFLAFEWRYLTPSNSVSSVGFYQNCLRYRKDRPLLQMVSKGCATTCSPQPLIADGDSTSRLLTNGGQDGMVDKDFLVWPLEKDQKLEVTLDLELITPGIERFALQFRGDSETTKPVQSISISISDDGERFNPLTTLTQPNVNEGRGRIYEGSLQTPVQARFVRFEILSLRSDLKVECCEIAVFSEAPHWISNQCDYVYSQPPSPEFPDEGRELTDWEEAPRLYAQAGWTQPREPIEITLDLKEACSISKVESFFFRKDKFKTKMSVFDRPLTLKPIVLPDRVEVSFSTDNQCFTPALTLTADPCPDLSSGRYWLLPEKVDGRYVRLRITPNGQEESNLMISEFRVFGQRP